MVIALGRNCLVMMFGLITTVRSAYGLDLDQWPYPALSP
jgi:hypothetical protein